MYGSRSYRVDIVIAGTSGASTVSASAQPIWSSSSNAFWQ
jgi:hypothetical protein